MCHIFTDQCPRILSIQGLREIIRMLIHFLKCIRMTSQCTHVLNAQQSLVSIRMLVPFLKYVYMVGAPTKLSAVCFNISV